MTETVYGPVTPAAISTFQWKYAQRGETYRDVCNRVAFAITDSPDHYHKFRRIMLDGRFIPGGRVLAGVGTTKGVTAANCYVSGTINDSLVDANGIMDRLSQGATTLRMGGGIGYDFSTIRPRGSLIRTLESHASGPVSYIRLYDAMGSTIASAGERRGAQMGILRIDHPDIEEFIHCKQNSNQINSFNLSVAVTDEFMYCLQEGKPFNLKFEGVTYRTIDPKSLWESIMRSTWDWAEPGVIFIDTINRYNNLWYCETISATNPCAEQPLPPFGACFLGAINLARCLTRDGSSYVPNWHQLTEDIPHIVRAMDRVIDVTHYPLEEHAREAASKRRIGIGVMGAANFLEALGYPYGTAESREMLRNVMGIIAHKAYEASIELAKEKGPFPLFSRYYLEGKFIQKLPDAIQERLSEHGIRNSHLITVAPTGTTAFCMDNVSSGIEPVFSVKERRRVMTLEGTVEYEVEDYGHKFLNVSPRPFYDITPQEHIDMLCAAQDWCDSSISKTCNVPSSTPWNEFKEIYISAWRSGAKGCSTYQDGGLRAGIREMVTDCQGPACTMETAPDAEYMA